MAEEENDAQIVMQQCGRSTLCGDNRLKLTLTIVDVDIGDPPAFPDIGRTIC